MVATQCQQPCGQPRQRVSLQDAGIRICAIAGNHDSPRSLGYDGGILPHEEMNALGAIRLFRATDTLEPCLALENLDRLGADAICVGHLHTRNQKCLPGGALLLNPGAPEHVNFGEEHQECGFWMLYCEPGRMEAEYIVAAPQPMQTLHIDVADALNAPDEADTPETHAMQNAAETLTLLMRSLVTRIEAASRPEQLLRVRLAGRIPRSRYQEIDLGRLEEMDGPKRREAINELLNLRVLADLESTFKITTADQDGVDGAGNVWQWRVWTRNCRNWSRRNGPHGIACITRGYWKKKRGISNYSKTSKRRRSNAKTSGGSESALRPGWKRRRSCSGVFRPLTTRLPCRFAPGGKRQSARCRQNSPRWLTPFLPA